MDKVNNLFFSDGGFDGKRIILKDADQAFLNVFSIYVLRVLDKQIYPPGEIKLVLAITNNNLFKESIDSLKDIG